MSDSLRSVQAEQAILGAVLAACDPAEAIGRAIEGGLTPGDFYKKAHAHIYEAMRGLFDRGEVIDLVVVVGALERAGQAEKAGGPAYLSELADRAGTSAGITHYAGQIRDAALRRRLVDVGRQIAETSGNGHHETAHDALEAAEGAIFALRDTRHQSDAGGTVGATLGASLREIEKRMTSTGPTGTPTGFTDLDDLTGGLQPGDLAIIAGRPSMGKTALALNIALAAAAPWARETAKDYPAAPAAFFSLEMSTAQLNERLLSAVSGANLQAIRTGRGLRDSDLQALTVAASRLSGIPLHIDDRPALTVNEIRATSRRIASRGGLGLVVVDYLQLMRGDGQNREQEISGISRGLKALAKELHVPVLALSQLNRALESRNDKRPNLSDLRESGAIEQDADIIGFVYRPEVYGATADNAGQAELLIRKNRNGPTRDLSFHWVAHTNQFRTAARL